MTDNEKFIESDHLMKVEKYQVALDEINTLDPSNFQTKKDFLKYVQERTPVLQDAIDELSLFRKQEMPVLIDYRKDNTGQTVFSCPHCNNMIGVDLDKIKLLQNRYCSWCGKKLMLRED